MHAPNFELTAITAAPPPPLQTEQSGTKRNTGQLTPRQLTAVALLTAGKSLSHTAAALKVGRTTLHRWRHEHPAFRAELARRQHDLYDTAARQLRKTLLRAIKVVNLEITAAQYRADRVKTALALLRHVDLPALLAASTDPATADHALDDLIRADRASRNLSPDHEITDLDRDEYLAHLDPTDDTPVPTQLRLSGGSPYPTEQNAPPPDPDFHI